MRRLLGCGMMIVLLIGAYFFVRGWNKVTTWGTGTGSIAAQKTGRGEAGGASAGSRLRQIAQNPARFKDKRATVTGRVRSSTRLASNRNMYLLVEGNDRILVIDDKAPPRPYYPRTVSGIVHTFGPQAFGQNYAYLVDVKSGVKVNAPRWNEVQKFFAEHYNSARREIREEIQRP